MDEGSIPSWGTNMSDGMLVGGFVTIELIVVVLILLFTNETNL